MSFTDQKPRLVTEKYCPGNWGGYKDGRLFRCHLCGHRFKVGDTFRWALCTQAGFHIMVCAKCDNLDIVASWANRVEEYKAFKEKFWWAINEEDLQ